MEDGVFHPADVLIHRQPVISLFFVQHPFSEPGGGVSGKIPGGLDKGIHGVGFAPGRALADRAGGLVEALQGVQR